MQWTKNRFGETVCKWSNHTHPDNPNFMQIVYWFCYVKPDGRFSVGYRLDNSSNIKVISRGEGGTLPAENEISKYA